MAKLTRSELKRQAIIDAAKKAFKENGVQATSMDKLAEVANVSKRTVYNHFKTKENLVMFLAAELWEKAIQANVCPYNSQQPLIPQLKELVLNEIRFLSDKDYIDLARVAFGHFFYKPEVIRKEIEKVSIEESAIYKWLVAAQDDGKMSFNDIDQTKDILDSLIMGGCFLPQLLGVQDGLDLDQQQSLADEIAAILVARYGVNDEES
ncbi:TetR/AcrR family transcriptional regulator [Spongorhabdus nitratireducens]